MSCPCSSPELEAFKFTLPVHTDSFRFDRTWRPARHRFFPHRSPMLFRPVPISSTVAFNKRRVPHPPTPSPANLFSLSIQAHLSCVDVQAQNQAFVHFAVASSAAEFAIAL